MLERLADGIDVTGLQDELDRNPQLWSQYESRIAEGTPHEGVPDIWVRYRAPEELTTIEAFREPHVPVFYPAWYQLPSLHPIVSGLVRCFTPVMLGGVLLTRIPPKGQVKRHTDRGSWHAEFMNLKLYIGVVCNDDCINEVDGQEVVIKEGELWTFNNLIPHSVRNDGDTERITLIVCMRTEL